MKTVIVGCGNIAESYARDLSGLASVELVGFHDLDLDRAERMAATHGGHAFTSLEDACAAADLVVNLTIFEAHEPVSRAALEAGCHVYSEKPVAMTAAGARSLAVLAEERGLRLAAAPFTFLGGAQQKARDLIESGELGTVRVAYAEVNHGRIETWHPNPEPFYAAGPMLDVGVYPLALVTAFLGPVVRVMATSHTILPDRTTLDGVGYEPGSPDFWLVELVHRDGQVTRLTVNFYVKGDEGIAFHGDAGSVALDSWHSPDSGVSKAAYGDEWDAVEVDAPELDWSVGVAELVAAEAEGRPSRLHPLHAVHLVEVLDAIAASADKGVPIGLDGDFPPPAPI